MLADMVDVSLVLAQVNVTPMAAVRRSHELLSVRAGSSVGIVLTGVEESSPAYRNYYGHFGPSGNREGIYEMA
jgi:hypothetical protein